MWQDAKQRLREIIQTDVMINEQWDFLATHVPFNKLFVQKSGKVRAREEIWSEEEVFERLAVNPRNEHRFMIVRGDHGAGKSHLIRWLHARIKSSPDFDNYKVVFIRRIENNLQGALNQMLQQGVVTDPEQEERFRRFMGASQVQSRHELKLKIYFGFLAKLQSDTRDDIYRTPERERLATFLKDPVVEKYMLGPGGPIERFYRAVFEPRIVGEEADAAFLKDDFVNLRSIRQHLRENSVKRVFAEVTRDDGALRLARYLNDFSESVIQELANLTQGDVSELITEMRRDLQQKGQRLIVLIEDLTTFTGIQSDLIRVLSVSHGGEYSDLCPISVVIGITNAYYQSYFLGNFQDRVTHQITLNEDTYDPDILARLAAKYINAAYLSEKEAMEWLEQGARLNDLPYRTWEPEFSWDDIDIGGISFSLFPFTNRALVTLFERLEHDERNPRFFLRNVVRPQLESWFDYQLGINAFPNADYIDHRPVHLDFVHNMRIENSRLSVDEKERLRLLVGLWGDGTLDIDASKERRLADLPIEFFELVGFDNILDLGLDRPIHDQKVTGVALPVKPPPSERKTQGFDKRLADIESWYRQGEKLAFSAHFKDLVRDFVVDVIDWQTQGVPAKLAHMALTSARNVFIEDQSETSMDASRAMVTVTRKDGYQLLVSLCHWNYHDRSWNFGYGPYMQYQVIAWLEANKQQIIDKVMGSPAVKPTDLLAWSMALEYLRLGISNSLHRNITNDELFVSLFRPSLPTEDHPKRDQESLWERLQLRVNKSKKSVYESSKEMMVDLFKTKMGSVTRASSKTEHLYHRKEIDDAFRRLSDLDWDPTSLFAGDVATLPPARGAAVQELQAVIPEVQRVLEENGNRLRELVEKLQTKLGAELDVTAWSRATTAARNFLDTLWQKYQRYTAIDLYDSLEKLHYRVGELADLCKLATLSDDMSFHEKFCLFSEEPHRLLNVALDTFETIEQKALNERDGASDALAGLNDKPQQELAKVSQLRTEVNKVRELAERLGGDSHAVS